MRTLIVLPFFFFFVLFSIQTLGSPVWKVTHGNNTLFLGGTVHILGQEDYPLPPTFDTAYIQSNTLVFETDLAAAGSPSFARKMSQLMVYSDGTKLYDIVSNDTQKALSTYFSKHNIPENNFTYFTPVGISLGVTLRELQRMGMRAELGVEHHYMELNKKDRKPVYGLETPEEQLSFLASMTEVDPDELVVKSIRDLELITVFFATMKRAWRAGNLKEMEKLGITEMQREFPHVYDNLLVKRNANWLPKIESMLTSKQTEFVLVGALHLPGNDGLINLLKNKGYLIERL